MYHVTKREYLVSILQKGILPDFKPGITISGKDKHNCVFLTNDPRDIICNQAGTKWCQKHDVIVLEIDINKNDYEPYKYYSGGTYTLSNHEFVTSVIKSKQIKKILSFHDFMPDYYYKDNKNIFKTI